MIRKVRAHLEAMPGHDHEWLLPGFAGYVRCDAQGSANSEIQSFLELIAFSAEILQQIIFGGGRERGAFDSADECADSPQACRQSICRIAALRQRGGLVDNLCQVHQSWPEPRHALFFQSQLCS